MNTSNNKIEYDETTNHAVRIAIFQSDECILSDFIYTLREADVIKSDNDNIRPYVKTTAKKFEDLINVLTYKLKEIEKDDLFNQMLYAIRSLMKNKNMTYEEAMAILDIPKEKQRQYAQGLKRKFYIDIG